MKFSGQILKMISENGKPIQYYMNLSGDLFRMNDLFGKKLHIQHTGYQCKGCGSAEKIFRMGFCKKCFFESPYASETIIRPELSKAHLGIEERDLEVEKEIQLVPHIVYLSFTGNVKVGVTRVSQVPTRWIDQGATLALPIARTNNRYEAGVIEVALKEHIADRTNYRDMLKDLPTDANLEEVRNQLQQYFPAESRNFYSPEESLVHLEFPYSAPEKVKSFTLDKQPEFEGVLRGIKGQYLSFEGGDCINVRSHEGYVIDLEVN